MIEPEEELLICLPIKPFEELELCSCEFCRKERDKAAQV